MILLIFSSMNVITYTALQTVQKNIGAKGTHVHQRKVSLVSKFSSVFLGFLGLSKPRNLETWKISRSSERTGSSST